MNIDKSQKYTIYLNNVKENWIVDRTRKEWYEFNKDISTKNIYRSDLIWLIASWNWNNVSKSQLSKKKVICSIYHIDETKFDNSKRKNFQNRDKLVDEYHVISLKTKEQVRKLTDKKITSIPFWVNTNIWFQISDKEKLLKKYDFKDNEFLIGSFQRDSEGSNVELPKLSKGPDRFIEIVKELNNDIKNIHIVLTGRKRNYIINELEKENIKYTYFEMADFSTINELYNCLSLYIVSSRYEGGPQAILECGVTKTPIISTDVGVATEILANESIFNMENFKNAQPNVEYAFTNSMKYEMKSTFQLFHDMFESLYEN
tara:strand:- start:3155 stop:4102 length:948 start_codon:yes stop_codon:yes gene_type:complete